jgi:hypothetical protein
MEEKIRYILRQCKGIKPRARRKPDILNNYDIIYRTMVDVGMNSFVAHTWTMLELAKLHGRLKVERILGSPVYG